MSSGARSESFGRETSYWFEVDTLNKYVKLHTSDNDGELTTYDITLNTKEGSLEIKDGVGNSVLMNSSEGSLTATMNSKVTLKAPEIVLDGDVTTTGTQAIVGKATLQSGMGVSGGSGSTVDIEGDLRANGNGSFTGNVTSSNIN
jgi:phage baseplate assembly protein gpV